MVQGLEGLNRQKILLGLTGVFGSGKTTVGRFFEECGALRLDADDFVREALGAGSKVFREIVRLFPETVAPTAREVNRKVMAEIIFSDPRRRKQLEAVVHPYVFERLAEGVAASEKAVAVLEVPLLFETGFDQACSRTVVVSAPEAVTVSRLQARGFDAKEIARRLQAQMMLEEKTRRADFIIDNSGDLNQTKQQVNEIWEKLTKRAKGAT